MRAEPYKSDRFRAPTIASTASQPTKYGLFRGVSRLRCFHDARWLAERCVFRVRNAGNYNLVRILEGETTDGVGTGRRLSNEATQRMRAATSYFTSGGPLPEWHDFVYETNVPYRDRRLPVLLAVLWIAVIDLCWQRTNLAIFYLAPMLLLAESRSPRALWRLAAVLIALTYGGFFLKNLIGPLRNEDIFVDYRLINRTLVAATIVALVPLIGLWQRTREAAGDEELPESFRREDDEISATFAALVCVPLVAVIAVIDLFAPANYNLAILYPVPILICAWSRSRSMMWAMLFALQLLSAVAFWWGPAVTSGDEMSLTRNRILTGIVLLVVTAILDYWIGSDRRAHRAE